MESVCLRTPSYSRPDDINFTFVPWRRDITWIPVETRVTTTPHECVDALREAARQLGESPSKAQYERLGFQPASATIIRTMGGWNEAKRRVGLAIAPSSGSRVGPMPDHLEVTADEWRSMSVDQRWHYRNREWNTKRTLRRRVHHRAWLYEYKRSSGGCTRCDEDDPACLEFHHVDPMEKTLSVTELVSYGYSTDSIRDEIEACVLLCANCHRQEHHDAGETADDDRDATGTSDVGSRQHLRQWSSEYRRSNGCKNCGVTDPTCLEFHHLDPTGKRRGVGSLISDGYSKEEVLEEIERCVVICANCHRKAHYDAPSAPPENDRV